MAAAVLALLCAQIKGMQVIGRVAAVCKSDMLDRKGCVHVNAVAVNRVSERGDAMVMSTALQAGNTGSSNLELLLSRGDIGLLALVTVFMMDGCWTQSSRL